MMTISSQKDLDGLKKIGKVVALAIQKMKRHARPGMTTHELDEIGERVLKQHGALAAPKKLYNFPGTACISLNHDVAHGIPGSQVIRPGDLINIDVSAELDGYYADSGHSFQIAPHDSALVRLCDYAHHTMMKVISSLSHGVKLNQIGKIMQAEAKKGGYRIVENLCSHGIGRALHEEPDQILPFYNPHDQTVLHEGLVLTIEPFLSTGPNYVVEQPDGWTLKVPHGGYAAQHEHTIVITKGKPIILTVA